MAVIEHCHTDAHIYTLLDFGAQMDKNRTVVSTHAKSTFSDAHILISNFSLNCTEICYVMCPVIAGKYWL